MNSIEVMQYVLEKQAMSPVVRNALIGLGAGGGIGGITGAALDDEDAIRGSIKGSIIGGLGGAAIGVPIGVKQIQNAKMLQNLKRTDRAIGSILTITGGALAAAKPIMKALQIARAVKMVKGNPEELPRRAGHPAYEYIKMKRIMKSIKENASELDKSKIKRTMGPGGPYNPYTLSPSDKSTVGRVERKM